MAANLVCHLGFLEFSKRPKLAKKVIKRTNTSQKDRNFEKHTFQNMAVMETSSHVDLMCPTSNSRQIIFRKIHHVWWRSLQY